MSRAPQEIDYIRKLPYQVIKPKLILYYAVHSGNKIFIFAFAFIQFSIFSGKQPKTSYGMVLC